MLVVGLVLSRLDSGNGLLQSTLLVGIPGYLVRRLQSVLIVELVGTARSSIS